MNISSLTFQDKQRLGELLEDLTDILRRKDSLIESASKQIDRMNKIVDMQSKLDEKGSEFLNIKTPIEAKELQDLVEKSDKLSKEKDEINEKSVALNHDLEELYSIEEDLMQEINEILSASKVDNEEKGIYVESLNAIVDIIDADIPKNRDRISRENDEIINCPVELIAEIANEYFKNINKIVVNNDDSNFDELKEKVEKYKLDKNSSYDKQLELLKKSFEESKTEEVKPEEPITEKPIIEEPIIEEKVEVTEPSPEDNIVSLSSVLGDTPVENQENSNVIDFPIANENDVVQNNAPEAPIIPDNQPGVNIVYFKDTDKVVPNKIVKATKDKLNNKIIDICWGSFPVTRIDHINTQTESLDSFNLENFVTNKAA